MAEYFPNSSDEESSKAEIAKEKAFERAERMKENLMKLEKSVIDEVDEAAQAARGAIQAMGFDITPVLAEDDDEE